MQTPEHDLLLTRIRAEYLEMPGMTLRLEQVARLCGIERSLCKRLLDALVDAGFLCIRSDGAYARLTADRASRSRPARASLEAGSAVYGRRRAG